VQPHAILTQGLLFFQEKISPAQRIGGRFGKVAGFRSVLAGGWMWAARVLLRPCASGLDLLDERVRCQHRRLS
jgi:hypothetical protein